MAAISDQIEFTVLTNSFDGLSDSGDLGIVRQLENHLFVAAIDVAGHGTNAAALAKKIELFLQSNNGTSLEDVVTKLHDFISGSRGCAGSFALVDPASGTSTYVGVGNTLGRIVGENARRFVNRAGIIGYNLPALSIVEFVLRKEDVFILCSDGVQDFHDITAELQLHQKPANEIASAIMDEFDQRTDDALCIVLKHRK